MRDDTVDVMSLRPPYVCSFPEDMQMPDRFDPGQVDVSDSAFRPADRRQMSIRCLRWGVPAWRTIASQ
jgi:hypothetical protein